MASFHFNIIKDDFIPSSGLIFSVLLHPYRAGNLVYSTRTGMLAPSMDKAKEGFDLEFLNCSEEG
uniref:Uncharacterized protein n=1 Tax=Cucumis melo TaxID=3656 RepID=A0A9I9DU46_CUCME